MIYLFLADVVVMIHLAFILFAVFGGFLVLWRWRWAWLHIPAVTWAALVELTGWICPLTPLENHFRAKGGDVAYSIDFIERYVMPVLYPESLTRRHQILLGMMVMTINLAVYAWCLYRQRRHP